MTRADDLEKRLIELIAKVQDRLEVFKSDFYKAGYDGDVLYISPFLNLPGDMRPSSFDKLLLEFYRGVEKRLREEKDPFEKAFLLLTTYYGFIPIEHPSTMLEKAKTDEKRQFEQVGTLMFTRPDILRDHKERFGVDYNANQALAILNQAGAYVLAELGRRSPHYHEQFRSATDDRTLVQNFKKYIDRVIEIGRLPWEREPEDTPARIIDAAGNPIELLKIISQNANRFVRRYATLHGYEMGNK